MSKQQLVYPKSQLQGQIPIERKEETFEKLYGDIPAVKIPKGGFAKLENAISYPHEVIGRRGTYRYSTLDIPSLATGFTASKSGTTITATVGTFYASYGRGDKYFVWADTGIHEQITGFTDGQHVSVRQTGTHASTGACWIREAGYGSHFHKPSGKIVCQWGGRLFYTDYTFSTFTQIYGKTFNTIASSKTTFKDFDEDYIIAINASGLYKICLTDTYPYYTKINTPVPTTLVTDVTVTDDLTFGRRYVYAMSTLIDGVYTGNRIGDPADANVPTLTIEQESGTTKYNKNFIDYGEVFTEKKVGTGEETYGLIIGGYGVSGSGSGINKDIEFWRQLSAAGFSVNMNGLGRQDIFVDYSVVDTLDDVCRVTQNAIRVYVPSATVGIDVNTATGYARFLISTGEIDGSYVTAIGTDPIAPPMTAGMTDISGTDWATGCGLMCDTLSGGVIATDTTDPNWHYTAPSCVSTIEPGDTSDTSAIPDFKWTHASIYVTKDVGKEGTNPNTGLGNDPEIFVYNEDIPLMKAFTCSNAATGIVTATAGWFSKADVGNTLTWANAQTTVISYLCDVTGTKTFNGTSRYAIGSSVTIVGSQSCIMGSTDVNSVLTCSRTAATITKSGGRSFVAADVGKPLFWANGSITWIKSFTNATTVVTIDSGDISSTAVAIDPVSRKFNDTTTDLIIHERIGFNFYHPYRFYEPLPDGMNVGTIVPGFLIVGKRDEKVVYYSQISAEREYRVGYYYIQEQYDNKLKDGLQAISEDPDSYTVWCSNSTYVSNTSNPVFGSRGAALLYPLTLQDGKIGCIHVRTMVSISIGQRFLIASDYTGRLYSPSSGYSDSMTRFQVENILKGASMYNFAHYDNITGYLVWLSTEI